MTWMTIGLFGVAGLVGLAQDASFLPGLALGLLGAVGGVIAFMFFIPLLTLVAGLLMAPIVLAFGCLGSRKCDYGGDTCIQDESLSLPRAA